MTKASTRLRTTTKDFYAIKFVYSQDEKVSQQQYLIEQFEAYVKAHSNWEYKNPFEADEEEFTV